MLSTLKVLVLATCVAFVVGDGHVDCESDEVKACSKCACLAGIGGPCSDADATFCTDPVQAAACKTREHTHTHARAFVVLL